MKRLVLFLAIAFLLAGCGGNSSVSTSVSTAPTPPNPQAVPTPGEAHGLYQGSYSDALLPFFLIVLPNDMLYQFESKTVADGSMVELWTFRTGQGNSDNGNYTANLTGYFAGEELPMTLTAKYVPGTNLSGQLRFASTGATHAFTATALPSGMAEFHTAANLSNIVGTWRAWSLCDPLVGGSEGGCDPFSIVITASGELTVAGSNCLAASIVPETGHNFFKVTIPVGAGACSSASAAGSGAGFEMLLPNGTTRQLMVGAMVDKKPFVFVAQR